MCVLILRFVCVGAATCTLCEAGKYSAAGAAACADCPALSSSLAGSTDCACAAGAEGQEAQGWVHVRRVPVLDGFTAETQFLQSSSYPAFDGIAWCDMPGGTLGERLRVYGGFIRSYLVFNLSSPAVDASWTIADAELSLYKYYDNGNDVCVPGSYGYRLRVLLDPSLIRVLTQSDGAAIAQSLKAVLDQPLSLGQSPFETEFTMNHTLNWYTTNVTALVKHAIESSSSLLVALELRHPGNHRCSQFRSSDRQGVEPRLDIFYQPSLSCKTCGVGTYKNATGTHACANCPAHTHSGPGSGDLTNCTCVKGYTGVDGAVCSPCIRGTYKDVNGSAACELCPAGKYSSASAATSSSTCSDCPAYSYSGAGSVDAANCSCGKGYTVGRAHTPPIHSRPCMSRVYTASILRRPHPCSP